MSHYILSGLYLLCIDKLTDLEANFDTSLLKGEENYSDMKKVQSNLKQFLAGFFNGLALGGRRLLKG